MAAHLKGVKMQWKKYRQYSDRWDHDHCVVCGAKFAEFDGEDILHEGYATTGEYPRGADYEWVCKTCFDELQTALNWIAE